MLMRFSFQGSEKANLDTPDECRQRKSGVLNLSPDCDDGSQLGSANNTFSSGVCACGQSLSVTEDV